MRQISISIIIIICFTTLSILPATISKAENSSLETPREYVNAKTFFKLLFDQLEIDTSNLVNKYKYCSPEIAYLVDKGYITPYCGYLITNNYKCNAEFLIDKALLMVEYFERPLDNGKYNSPIERLCKETGLVEETFDIFSPLSLVHSMILIKKIVNTNFTQIKYSNIDLKIEYEINNFYDMALSLKKIINYLDMLP